MPADRLVAGDRRATLPAVDKATLAVLNHSERLLVAQTGRAELDGLDEDEVLALHNRIRLARNKYTGLYRRGASARVVEQGARGKARPKNQQAATKAEAFEEALSRVSRRLAALSRQSAGALRAERLATAGTRPGRPTSAQKSGATRPAPMKTPARRSVTDKPRGDLSLRSPLSAKKKATTKAATARKQARRDSR